MSKIVVGLEDVADSTGAALLVHHVLRSSIGLIKSRIQAKLPIAEFRLFHNDHDDVAKKLRALISGLQAHGRLWFLEASDDECAQVIAAHDKREIALSVVLNMLDQHDHEVRRQSEG